MSAPVAATAPVSAIHAPQGHIHPPHPRRPRPTADADGSPLGGTQNTTSIRGTRGGRGGRSHAPRNNLLALRPASVAPPQQAQLSQATSGDPALAITQEGTPQAINTSNNERGGKGRGRGGRAPQRRNQQNIVQNRQFGGALTAVVDEDAPDSTQSSALQADAPVFEPGQSYAPSVGSRRPPRQELPKKRRLSKSTAPDFPTRIHDDINNRQYECPICTSEVLRQSKVWSCKKCWTVFHLDCVKKWSNNADSGVATPSAQDGAIPLPRQWRCPGCNLAQDVKPSSYTCWCGKEYEPRSFAGLPPHSCGQTCGKHRELPKKCPHPCELLCHAGPCPPCTHMGPTQRCFCGKETTTRRCVETQYEGGWSCGQPCGDIMPCGEHSCQRDCHEGLCGACEVRMDARCYCGKEEKAILCCDKDDEKESVRVMLTDDGETITERWTGLFACVHDCGRSFDCGKHHCEKSCHAQGDTIAHCPRSPDVVTNCPCGKTRLEDISEQPRISCEDPIPNCSKPCLKELPCGHPCQQTCHTGQCYPCLQKVTIHCRCGRTESSSICHQGTEEPPQCTRVCHTTLNCGRHECGERCCPGEKKAAERQSTKRKSRPLSSAPRPVDDGFEAEHICTRPCGRLLKCGNHLCQELCHKGQCGSCREAIFDEISCNCGRTVLQPPLPCGTEPPQCRFDCERRKVCGHPQVPHNCHSDEDPCPKCPFLTEKACLCGKKSLKNQQCWFTDVRCGEICGRKLKCGSHTCRKTCHRPGECEDASGPCQQACGKEKKFCGHPDEDTCHAPYPCREDKPCTHKLIITCDCQHHKQEIRCNASRHGEGNTKKTLKCDDECARLERNRKLRLALDISQEHKDDHIPYSTETINMFAEHPKWCQEQEREFRVFATDDSEKRLRYKPMPATQRAFLHSLAEDFGFDSESMDPEPHRHVAVFKTPRFVSAPNKTLRECLRIRQNQQQLAAAEAHAVAAKAKSSIVNEPYNGFLLMQPRFALTVDELATELAAVQGPAPKLAFKIQFLGNGDVALKATLLHPSRPLSSAGPTTRAVWGSNNTNTNVDRTLDTHLKELRHPLARAYTSQSFGSLQLYRFDGTSLAPLRRELDSATEGGWSQVAAKAAAPKGLRAPGLPAVGTKSAYTVLGSLAAKKKKEGLEVKPNQKKVEKEKEEVVEDWEEAEGLEEQKEEMARTNSEEIVEGTKDVVDIVSSEQLPMREEEGLLQPDAEVATPNGTPDLSHDQDENRNHGIEQTHGTNSDHSLEAMSATDTVSTSTPTVSPSNTLQPKTLTATVRDNADAEAVEDTITAPTPTEHDNDTNYVNADTHINTVTNTHMSPNDMAPSTAALASASAPEVSTSADMNSENIGTSRSPSPSRPASPASSTRSLSFHSVG